MKEQRLAEWTIFDQAVFLTVPERPWGRDAQEQALAYPGGYVSVIPLYW